VRHAKAVCAKAQGASDNTSFPTRMSCLNRMPISGVHGKTELSDKTELPNKTELHDKKA